MGHPTKFALAGLRRHGGALLRFPALALIVAPVAAMTLLSFCSARFPTWPWPGWSIIWYRQLLTDSTLHASLLRSVLIGVSAAAASLSLGFPAGYWLARLPEEVGVRLLLVLTVPAIVPFILFGLSLLEFTRMLGIDRTLLAVGLGHLVVFCPIVTALCYHRCRQLEVAVEDAARELGASEWRILAEIVGGQAWKSLAAAFLVVFVLSWDEFIIAWFVSGFDKTYPVYVRNALESTMSPEVHAAGVVVALFCCGLALLSIRLITSSRR